LADCATKVRHNADEACPSGEASRLFVPLLCAAYSRRCPRPGGGLDADPSARTRSRPQESFAEGRQCPGVPPREPGEAEARQADIAAYLERTWAALRAEIPVSLSYRQVVALSALLYRSWVDDERT